MNSRNHALSATDLDSIRSTIAAAQVSQADPAPLLALHTAETVIVNIAGRRVLGRDAFGEAMSAALASPLKDVHTEVAVEDIRSITSDTAIASCTKTVRDGRAGDKAGQALPASGTMTYVLVRVGADWMIALAQTTPVASA